MFLSCRSFVVNTTFSTGLVGVEVTTGQKQQLLDGRTVENKGKLFLTEIFPSVQKTFPSNSCCFCPVAITTLSTGLVGVEVTSVSWLGQLNYTKKLKTRISKFSE